jgi:ribosomal protein S18 acetylase RimI-like enzyme
MRQAERIQAYMRETARGYYDVVQTPPFTCFFHPRDALRFFNYAIPDKPVGGDLAGPLAELRAAFHERERLPRFEYVEGFAPDLATALEQAGFELELRAPVMTASTTEIEPPPEIPGLEIVPGEQDWRAYITVGQRAFGAGDEPEASDEEVEERRNRRDGVQLLGLLDGEPVAVAAATPPLDGLSEVAGIGTLEHARRRGIAGAMTAAAAREAGTKGAELVFLSPGSDAAQSVYARVGFRAGAETSLYYADPG